MIHGPEDRPETGNTESYRRIFQAIEDAAQVCDRLEPQAAYEMYDAGLAAANLDPTVYLSMSITSGGFARDEELTIGDVITQNSEYGTLAKQALINQHPVLREQDIILPSELGKVKGWSQSDYLLFWFHTIAGLKPQDTQIVSDHMQPYLTLPGFTDKTLPPEQRWQDYERFTNEYVRALREVAQQQGRSLRPSNIQAMLMILDGEMSLGGRAEELLCRRIGIPPQYHYLNAEVVVRDVDFHSQTRRLSFLGAKALSTNINKPPIAFVGVSAGRTHTDIAFMGAFRKTGLSNALFAAEYYTNNPDSRTRR